MCLTYLNYQCVLTFTSLKQGKKDPQLLKIFSEFNEKLKKKKIQSSLFKCCTKKVS